MTESQNNAIGTTRTSGEKLKQKIIVSILEVYQSLPDDFHAQYLFVPVRSKIFKQVRRHPFSETIMRYFRQLREDGVIKCDCISRQKSLYKKQTI